MKVRQNLISTKVLNFDRMSENSHSEAISIAISTPIHQYNENVTVYSVYRHLFQQQNFKMVASRYGFHPGGHSLIWSSTPPPGVFTQFALESLLNMRTANLNRFLYSTNVISFRNNRIISRVIIQLHVRLFGQLVILYCKKRKNTRCNLS